MVLRVTGRRMPVGPGFLISTLPPGTDASQVSVGGTVPSDGQRHSDVVTWSAEGLTAGVHTLVLTKVDGTYMTFDGVEVDNS